MKKGFKRELGQACKNRQTDHDSINRLLKRYKTQSSESVDLDCAQMMINLATDNLDIAKQVFDMISPQSRTEGLYTVYIKCLCMNNRIVEAMYIFKEMEQNGVCPHIRTFLPFFKRNASMDEAIFVLLVEKIFKYRLVPTLELFNLIFKHVPEEYNTVRLLQSLSNWYHEVPETLVKHFSISAKRCNPNRKWGTCNVCKWPLVSCDATRENKEKMKQCLLYNGIEQLDQFLSGKRIDIVVDGSNVAMHNNSDFNFNKVYKLLQSIPKDRHVLVVFHVGRKKTVRKQQKQQHIVLPKNVFMWYSKVGEDDDLSWLYATLAVNGKCVTSDKLRDHLYNRFSKVVKQYSFEKWVECHVIDFNFTVHPKKGWFVKLIWPRRWSTRTNYDTHAKEHVHFPVKKNRSKDIEWWCAKI